MAQSEKSTTRTTVTLEDDLKAWLEAGALRNRRDVSAQLNAVLEDQKAREEAGAKGGSK